MIPHPRINLKSFPVSTSGCFRLLLTCSFLDSGVSLTQLHQHSSRIQYLLTNSFPQLFLLFSIAIPFNLSISLTLQSEIMEVQTGQTKHKPEKEVPAKGFHALEELEYNILKYSSLEVPTQIKSIDTILSDQSWLHEITCGFHNKRHIVLLHGYGGSSLTYIRLFTPLAQKYCVHALDLMGMGLSGRRKLTTEMNKTELVDYYVDAIEEWRKINEIEKFTMAGHSFGGYMAANYSFKYPQRVERLVLISPIGTKFTDKETNEREFEQMRQKGSFGRRMFLGIARTFIGWEITPSRVLNWVFLGGYFLDRIVEGRLKLQDKEKDLWKDYFKRVSKLTPNSEASIWRLFFMPGAGTSNPTSKVLKTIKMPFNVQFYYGDSDWMEKQTAYDLCSNETPNRISYTTVRDSGHQIIFDNPELMAKLILENE